MFIQTFGPAAPLGIEKQHKDIKQSHHKLPPDDAPVWALVLQMASSRVANDNKRRDAMEVPLEVIVARFSLGVMEIYMNKLCLKIGFY